MRQFYVYLGLSLPCKVSDEMYESFQDYIDKVLNRFTVDAYRINDITFDLVNLSCQDYDILDATVEVEGLPSIETLDEDDFIAIYAPAINQFLADWLIPQINDTFKADYILGNLPYADIAFIDDSIYVKLGYDQTRLSLDFYPAEVNLNVNVEDLASDLYYTDEA